VACGLRWFRRLGIGHQVVAVMTEDHLNELARKAVNNYLKKIDGSDSKIQVVKALLKLLAVVFILLFHLDGKAVAVKTILGFLVSMTEPSELDEYFSQIEKRKDMS
jgi:hypothetical protein